MNKSSLSCWILNDRKNESMAAARNWISRSSARQRRVVQQRRAAGVLQHRVKTRSASESAVVNAAAGVASEGLQEVCVRERERERQRQRVCVDRVSGKTYPFGAWLSIRGDGTRDARHACLASTVQWRMDHWYIFLLYASPSMLLHRLQNIYVCALAL